MEERIVQTQNDTATLFLAGDVMTGRAVDQLLPHPADARIYESYCKSALDYVRLAERAHGTIARPVDCRYVWGDALAELDRRRPDARIINLETAITKSQTPELKGINYKMSPENIGVITAAGIDCCVLANNHVLDWGRDGLLEGLATLKRAHIHYAGAGRTAEAAASPAVLPLHNGRVLVFAFATPCSGVPSDWRAQTELPGVNLLPRLSIEAAEHIGDQVRAVAGPRDIVIASIHWGGNWGYGVPEEHISFAHRLLENGVHVVHGHSSHHVKGIEVQNGRLILYGCGDFIDDYEGITGYEEFRGDLVLMYFPCIGVDDGKLKSLEMVPLRISRMRLECASRADATWLAETLERQSMSPSTHVRLGADNVLRLEWQ